VVTGDGITASLPLTYDPYAGSWTGEVLFGTAAPTTLPLNYTFTIVDAYGQHVLGDAVGAFVQNFATNIQPADGGVTTGALTFSWTGLPDAGTTYGIQLLDTYGSMIWSVEGLTVNSYAYAGPSLPDGSYAFNLTACVPDGADCNVSMAIQTFTYQAAAGAQTVSRTYTLQAGWNLISFPMDLGVSGITDFINAVAQSGAQVESIWSYDPAKGGSPWRSYVAAAPNLADLTALSPGVGYWVKLTQGATVTLTGKAPAAQAPTLAAGWNLVGVEAPVTDVAGWLTGKGAAAVWGFDGQLWRSFKLGMPAFLNGLPQLDAGAGYYVWK